MVYLRCAPPPRLRAFVDHLWAFTDEVMTAPCGTLFADGGGDLMLNLGAPMQLMRGGERSTWRGAWISGPRTAPWSIALAAPGVTMVGARLRPLALGAVAGSPAAELAGSVLPLGLAWGAGASEVVESVAAAATPMLRLRQLAAALMRRLRHTAPPPLGLQQLVDRVLAAPHRFPVEVQAAALGISSRQLGRRFRAGLGLGPKQLQRIARFRAVLARLGPGGAPDWAALAATVGYCDQPHLCLEFREFTGMSPTAYRPPPVPTPAYVPWAPATAGWSDSTKTAGGARNTPGCGGRE